MNEDWKLPKETLYKKFKNKNPKISKLIKTGITTAPLVLPILGTVAGITTGIGIELSVSDTFGAAGLGSVTGNLIGNGASCGRRFRKQKNLKELVQANEQFQQKQAELWAREAKFNLMSKQAMQSQQNKSEINALAGAEESFLSFSRQSKSANHENEYRSNYLAENMNELIDIDFSKSHTNFHSDVVDYSPLSNINGSDPSSIFNFANMSTTDINYSTSKRTTSL